MYKAKIDVTKIDKQYLFQGAKGKYLDVLLIPNRNGTDQYGNDGMVTQSIPKEKRDAGEKGAILGNYQKLSRQAAPATTAAPAATDDSDDVPF